MGLPAPVLNAESALWVFPLHGPIGTGNHAGAAFETAGIFHDHLFFFIQGIEICRAGVDAEALLAGMTDLLVELNMSFLIVLEGIEG